MTQPLDPTLWEPDLSEKAEPVEETPEDGEIASVLLAADDTMPLVLVEVESTPRQLQPIDWAVAVLDDEGKVELRAGAPDPGPRPSGREQVGPSGRGGSVRGGDRPVRGRRECPST